MCTGLHGAYAEGAALGARLAAGAGRISLVDCFGRASGASWECGLHAGVLGGCAGPQRALLFHPARPHRIAGPVPRSSFTLLLHAGAVAAVCIAAAAVMVMTCGLALNVCCGKGRATPASAGCAGNQTSRAVIVAAAAAAAAAKRRAQVAQDTTIKAAKLLPVIVVEPDCSVVVAWPCSSPSSAEGSARIPHRGDWHPLLCTATVELQDDDEFSSALGLLPARTMQAATTAGVRSNGDQT